MQKAMKLAVAVKGYWESKDNEILAIITKNEEIKAIRMSVIPLSMVETESEGYDCLLDICNSLADKFDYQVDYTHLKRTENAEEMIDLQGATTNVDLILDLFKQS